MHRRNLKKMKRKSNDDIGVFNILLIGKNPHAISVADNIHAKFLEHDGKIKNPCSFNILDDILTSLPSPSHSWFNEFIFDISTTAGRFNNIILSSEFKDWMSIPPPLIERMYMKKLLQALNVVIVDISGDDSTQMFDKDIPQRAFNVNSDFLDDLFVWIDGQLDKIAPHIPMIRLVRSLSGKSMPYLGDVFGCLSGKKYKNILKTGDKMRFDVPILHDEFCHLTRGHDEDWIDDTIVVRSNSSLTSFFK